MSKKILIDGRMIYTSSGTYLERLLHYLQNIDSTNEYVVLLQPKDFDKWEPKNPKFSKEITVHPFFTFAEQIGLLKQIKSHSPDLVFFPMVQQPILYRGKTVTTIQDLTTLRFKSPTMPWVVFAFKVRIYKWLNKIVIKKSDGLITPTEFVKNDIISTFKANPKKITVTYESADKTTEKSKSIKNLESKKFILFVGRPAPNKNLERLVDAYKILHEADPELYLVFTGKLNAEYELLRKYTKKMGLNQVVFTDFAPDNELRWLYENAKCYVFPSLSEGFGLPALEAMLYDVPVASSNATCLPEVYKDAAHYFDPQDTIDMASKIEDVLTDKKLRDKLIKNSRVLIKSYSWEKMAKQTLAVFNKFI